MKICATELPIHGRAGPTDYKSSLSAVANSASRQFHHRQPEVLDLSDYTQEFDSRNTGHPVVEQNQVESARRQQLARGIRGFEAFDLMAALRQRKLQEPGQFDVIIDQENPGHLEFSGALGNLPVNPVDRQ
ncbi:MAG: hypothetical protein HY735_17465 [Verrucomicrobia bacterium]|nr:hypothetical protein [Verrucomicrobiota bacterium]